MSPLHPSPPALVGSHSLPNEAMAPSLFSSSNPGVQYFDIRPDQDHLVLRGHATEAPGVVLKGVLVLCNTEPLKAQEINLRFIGEAKTRLSYITGNGTLKWISHREQIFSHDWRFDAQNPEKANVIAAGNHEWPFELVLPGDLPESVEGSNLGWLVYRLKAVIRRGIFARNIEARQHIRLIRTLDPSSLALCHVASVKRVWEEKIAYNVSTPQKGVVFGSQLCVDYELVPLLKGLRIGKITTCMEETLSITVDAKHERKRTTDYKRETALDEYELPEDAETQDVNGMEGYILTRKLQLPQSLKICLQSLTEGNVIAKHRIKFVVAMHNPDGHVSEIRGTIDIHLFISPNIRINEQNVLEVPNSAPATMLEGAAAPPLYADHHLDMLYTDMDPHAFTTPASSRLASRIQSRRGSHEGSEQAEGAGSGTISPNTLEGHLTNLQSQQGPALTPFTPLSIQGDNHTSHVQLEEGSHDELDANFQLQQGAAPPFQHIEYSTEALSRVPSYNTALSNAARTPIAPDLPDYATATSRPPSPPSPANEPASIGSSNADLPVRTDASRQSSQSRPDNTDGASAEARRLAIRLPFRRHHPSHSS